MKIWSININNHNKTGYINLETLPIYLYLIENINYRLCDFVNYYLKIPFPNILPKKRDLIENCYCKNKKNHCKNHNNLYTLQDWYGDFGQYYHYKVCIPIFNWCYKHKKRNIYSFNIQYNKLKKIFFDNNEEFFNKDKNNKEIRKNEIKRRNFKRF